MKWSRTLAAATLAGLLGVSGGSAQTVAAAAGHSEGRLPSGALWAIDTPPRWNGTLLVWSHGYRPSMATEAPETAPRGTREALLAQGYALTASSYSTGGWALEQAAPDQIATTELFAGRVGPPRRTIAWGDSMGGLVTVAMAERRPDRIAAALPMCGSVGGAVGMMNEALDGAFALRTLLDREGAVQLTGISDDRANAAKVQAIVTEAERTPQGRARIALAATLAGMQGWTDAKAPQPAAADYAAQHAEDVKTFTMAVFLPRSDQERRAGGAFSWNGGVDYAAQLQRSGRKPYVQALYAAAGLDLARDLATLNAAPRVRALPGAVGYMKANYTPTGRLRIPMLSVHTIGDGLTSVTLEQAYAAAVAAAGRSPMLRQAYVAGGGHCAFTPAERLAALRAVIGRLDTGRWEITPEALNHQPAGVSAAPGETRFVRFTPTPFLRPCTTAQPRCPGEPSRKE